MIIRVASRKKHTNIFITHVGGPDLVWVGYAFLGILPKIMGMEKRDGTK